MTMCLEPCVEWRCNVSDEVMKWAKPFVRFCPAPWTCCPTFQYYGVWLPVHGLAGARWFVAGDSGLVFRTDSAGYARAMAKACGGEAKRIGHDGEPVDLPNDEPER